MRTIAILLLGGFILSFISCRSEEKITIPDLEEADALEYHIIHNSRMPDSDSVFMVNDRELIQQLSELLNAWKIPEQSCDPEGKIYFQKNGHIYKTVYFARTDKNCRYFAYVINGKKHYAAFGSEAVDLLNKMESGKTGHAGNKGH